MTATRGRLTQSTTQKEENTMARLALRSAAATALVVLGAVMASRSASAATADAAAYGQHVRECAQTMGFDDHHNPGMHQGFSMWMPDHAG